MAETSTGAAALQIPEKLELVNGWLVQVVDEHTCGAGSGSGAGHEPDCGLVPIASFEHLFELLAAEARRDLNDRSIIGAGHAADCSCQGVPPRKSPKCDCGATDAHIDDCD